MVAARRPLREARLASGMPDTADLSAHLASLGRMLLGFSGGIDSTFLAVVAARAVPPGQFLAVMGVSPSLGQAQYDHARGIAAAHRIPLREIGTDELDNPDYRANRLDRCYFCKQTLWRHLEAIRLAEGWQVILDGTNADDLGEHRPGLQAGAEAAIRSPLADLGWTKSDIREASRQLGIESWDAPAAPCLASRLTPHLTVTADRLAQVGQAEAFLRSLGVVGDLRVRHLGSSARIEVLPDQFGTLEANWAVIVAHLETLGFPAVLRDPLGYRRGALTASGT